MNTYIHSCCNLQHIRKDKKCKSATNVKWFLVIYSNSLAKPLSIVKYALERTIGTVLRGNHATTYVILLVKYCENIIISDNNYKVRLDFVSGVNSQ